MPADVSVARPAGAPSAGADAALWRHGAVLAEQHRADPSTGTGCTNAACRAGVASTCWVRPFAERLMMASEGSWVQRWTARHDARSCGLPVPEKLSAATWPVGATAVPADRSRRRGVALCGVGQ